ncbi:MAG: BMP family ABC transporter substrate-binding protein [Lachnospiraceae bacterium]|nr:BMP family ABC transporter substrate-binding protein [Lachnospiraceae bacterium]
MKKIILIVLIVILGILAGIFFINTQEQGTEVTEKATKVGVIFNGSKDDKSWSQSHYEGLEKSAKKLNLDITYEEFITADNILSVIDELIEDKCEIIIANSAIYSEQMLVAAEKYPEVFFFHATGTSYRKNLSTYFGRMYQMRYLTGIAAGLQT